MTSSSGARKFVAVVVIWKMTRSFLSVVVRYVVETRIGYSASFLFILPFLLVFLIAIFSKYAFNVCVRRAEMAGGQGNGKPVERPAVFPFYLQFWRRRTKWLPLLVFFSIFILQLATWFSSLFTQISSSRFLSAFALRHCTSLALLSRKEFLGKRDLVPIYSFPVSHPNL